VTGISWIGMEEMKAYLRNLPPHMAKDADPVVEETVDMAADSLRQSYPIGDTGKLRRGIKTRITRTTSGVHGIVRSTAPHAHLWEFGTEDRQTRQGWGRGRMDDQYNNGLVAIGIRMRKRMNQKLVGVVEAAGFTVTGGV